MIKEMGIQEFTDALSSEQPTPSGGDALTLADVLGTALGLMVGNLTVGKKKYADVEENVKAAMVRLEQMQARVMELADGDARVFAPLAASYGLPTGTEGEKAHKTEVTERCLLDATLVPMEIMEQGYDATAILEELEKKGNMMAASDVGMAAQFLRTTITGAITNVYINTKSMKDREQAGRFNEQVAGMPARGTEEADRVYNRILERLGGSNSGKYGNNSDNGDNGSNRGNINRNGGSGQ